MNLHRTSHRSPAGHRLVELLPRVVVNVHVYAGADADAIARVEGCGPVTETWVRDHLSPHANLTIRPVLDIEGLAPVDAYEIPERHRRAVHLMTPADTFPYSSSLTPDQLDHTEPYQHGPDAIGAGQSRVGNYGHCPHPTTGSRPTADGQVSNPSPASTSGATPTAPTTSSTTPAPAPSPSRLTCTPGRRGARSCR